MAAGDFVTKVQLDTALNAFVPTYVGKNGSSDIVWVNDLTSDNFQSFNVNRAAGTYTVGSSVEAGGPSTTDDLPYGSVIDETGTYLICFEIESDIAYVYDLATLTLQQSFAIPFPSSSYVGYDVVRLHDNIYVSSGSGSDLTLIEIDLTAGEINILEEYPGFFTPPSHSSSINFRGLSSDGEGNFWGGSRYTDDTLGLGTYIYKFNSKMEYTGEMVTLDEVASGATDFRGMTYNNDDNYFMVWNRSTDEIVYYEGPATTSGTPVFKQATVNASDVPSTQTDFPAYVDLSRIGITTQAQADSVRCYADSGKSTELPREIVSTSEMHVKVDSLTSSFTLYVEYDGYRSDYSVYGPYGRNAVWSDYELVMHLGEAVNNTTDGYIDSTGGGNDGTGTSMALTEVTAPTGKGQDFDGVSDGITVTSSTEIDAPGTNGALTLSAWIKKDTTGGTPQDYVIGSVNVYTMLHGYVANTFELFSSGGPRYNIAVVSDTNWNLIATSFNDATNTAISSLNGSTSTSTQTSSLSTASSNFTIGRANSANNFDGKISEVRVRSDAVSGDWFTTEYNNQSDEATFWGTWSVVGGGGGGGDTFTPRVSFIN